MKRRIRGIVASTKMEKTVVVTVERLKEHPIYKKKYKVRKKYKAHNQLEGIKEGDIVLMEETKPISKDKKWVVVEKLSS